MTSRLQVGLLLEGDAADGPDAARAVLAQARAGEQAGFDFTWMATGLREPRLEPFAMTAAIATVTERVIVGTCVAILPRYEPRILAETARTLATIAPQRLVIGGGIGWNPADLAAERRAERTARFVNAVHAIRASTGTPLWGGGHRLRAVARLGRLALDGYIAGPWWDHQRLQTQATCFRGAHPTPGATGFAVVRDAWTAAGDTAAEQQVWPHLTSTYRRYRSTVPGFSEAEPPRAGLAERFELGSPVTCAARLRALAERTGATHVCLRLRQYDMPLAMALDGIDRFAGEVLPRLGPLRC